MNTLRSLQVAILATVSFFAVNGSKPTIAASFDNQDVDSNKFIAVAAPYGNNQHQLLIIEQISNKRPCWSESGSNPVKVEPLLLNFDFTGICGRIKDSNGYSIRMNNQDLGLDYLLTVVERNGELLLVGTNRNNLAAPEILIGSTKGHTEGFEKIFLNPGWRLTRRTYQGKALGHIYLTSDAAPTPSEANSNSQAPPSSPQSSPRELIFTKPDGATPPATQTPATSSQTVTPTSKPEQQLPTVVVPTKPQVQTPSLGGKIPATSPQTLPSLPSPKSTVPVFVMPTQ